MAKRTRPAYRKLTAHRRRIMRLTKALIDAGEAHWRMDRDGTVGAWRPWRRKVSLHRKLGLQLYWLRRRCEQIWPDDPGCYAPVLRRLMEAKREIVEIAGLRGGTWSTARCVRDQEDYWQEPYRTLRVALICLELLGLLTAELKQREAV